MTTTDSFYLNGTYPVRMHATRFFGSLHVDGQQPRVAALACDDREVITLSLVGYETSVNAALAGLWRDQGVSFLLGAGVEWEGPKVLRRSSHRYTQWDVQLAHAKEAHYLSLPTSANLWEGFTRPVALPEATEDESEKPDPQHARIKAQQARLRRRFVIGNWDETTPHERSFLGHLAGMKLPQLLRDHQHPERVHQWAAFLWHQGHNRHLITPLHALGVRAWSLSGELEAWLHLIRDGVQEGTLPWRSTSQRIPEENPSHPALVPRS